jgi:FAD/FMN-containing dehydrogenase
MQLAGLVAVWPYGCAQAPDERKTLWVNDVHSQLNRTRVGDIVRPRTIGQVQEAIWRAGRDGEAISVAGGRHAMGGQQFGADTVHLDILGHDGVLGFDRESGIIEVQSGMQWPAVVDYLVTEQHGDAKPWGIAQKQTGTDRLSIGGTLAANAHGRGLNKKPCVQDIDSFVLVDANGDVKRCSRTENQELFRLAIGGYGLFGVVSSVRLRLDPRRKLERVVEVIDIGELMEAFESRKRDGFLYGDCQYAIDERSPDYLRKGVFSCYRPVDPATPIPDEQARLSADDWRELIYLAHTDKTRAFERYSTYYVSTSGQVYWSDLHQLSTYMDDYHRVVDARLGSGHRATEIISEVYVPRSELSDFLGEVREEFRKNSVNVIYGTIRLIEQDDETFLAWAKKPYVCIIFNLHTAHSPEGIDHSAEAFRRLIDAAIGRGGNYFLTYHRFARRDQILACYPQLVEFLRLKLKYDPQERFQSEWYRHYRDMFSDVL